MKGPHTRVHTHTYPQGVFLCPWSFLQGIIMTSARATPTQTKPQQSPHNHIHIHMLTCTQTHEHTVSDLIPTICLLGEKGRRRQTEEEIDATR